MATPWNVTIPGLLTNHTAVGVWDPLALKSWNFSDCTLYANFASKLIRGSIDAANLAYQSYDLCEIKDWDTISTYLASAIPRDIDPLPKNKIVDWYTAHCISLNFENHRAKVESNLSKEIIEKMFTWNDPFNHTFSDESASNHCTKELRIKLQIEGNSDIVGIGVLVSYFIEAGLASAFAVAIALEHSHSLLCPSKAGSKLRYRCVGDSVAASLSVFFWASMLLCLGMQVASLMTIVAEYKEKDITPRIQEWVGGEKYYINTTYFAAVASGFSSASVILAGQLSIQGNPRRRRFIIAILVVVGVLQTATLGYYLVEDSKSLRLFSRFQNPTVLRLFMFDTWYQPLQSSTTFRLYLSLYSFVEFVGLVTLIVAVRYRAVNVQRKWNLPEVFKKAIEVVFQATWLAMMWTTLALVMDQRAQLDEIDGTENPLNDWSFGQILALSTWVPVVVEFFYTFFCEPPIPAQEPHLTHARH
ncbi:hypothetical protein PG988_010497 [Apiospora saccharicola]